MKEVTLKIPDQKLSFFMELVKQLGLEISDQNIKPVIHDWQKEEVLNRIKNTKPEDYISREEAKKDINTKV